MRKGIFNRYMSNLVSVDDAISKGHKIISYPVCIIMFGTMGLSCFMQKRINIPFWIMAICFISSFLLAWLYWSFFITKWRIWAFENVENKNELKERAIQEMLIWNDNSIFKKTEIRTQSDKERLKKIECRFNDSDSEN